MYKITITGIDAHLLECVEQVGKIKGDRVKIKNLKNRSTLILHKNEFEEISIR